MSSESLLENPALFSGKLYDLDLLAVEYMDLAKIYESKPTEIKSHLFKFLHRGL
jgi:tRNA-dihydrouridine synthase 1